MMRFTRSGSTSKRGALAVTALLMSLSGFASTALAGQLPPVTGASFDGNVITWDPLSTAVGYNIYVDFMYVDTITGGAEYSPDSTGEYRIAGFDGNGNYSPLQVFDSSVVATSNIAIVDSFTSPPVELPSNSVGLPRDVTGIVYSSNAGELYWDNSSSPNSTLYIITMNGDIIGSARSNIYWIDSLLPNQQNMVGIAARNRDGEMSDVFTVSFDTRGNVFPTPATNITLNTPENTPEIIPEDFVVSPQNVRFEVYSSTIGELIWDRNTIDDEIVRTKVYRNGVLLGNTPGYSFYDNTRLPDTQYVYELVAVKANGFLSAPTVFYSGELDATVLLSGFSQIANENPHVEWSPVFQAMQLEDMPVDMVETSVEYFLNDGANATRKGYDCSAGFLTAERTPATVATSTTKLTFNECNIDGNVLTGVVDIASTGDELEIMDYENLTIESDAVVSVDGVVTSAKSVADSTRTITYDSFEILMSGNDMEIDTSIVLSQTIGFSGRIGSGVKTYRVDMTGVAPWTQGRNVIFSTREALWGNTLASTYRSGSLFISTDNGESLYLNADTGFDNLLRGWIGDIAQTGFATSYWDPRDTEWIEAGWIPLFRLPCIRMDSYCL